MLGLNVAFLPVLLLITMVRRQSSLPSPLSSKRPAFFQAASFLSAPVLPLFALPVFFVSTPRPRRFWPGVGERKQTAPQAAYYSHAIPAFKQLFYQVKLSFFGLGLEMSHARLL